MNAIGDICERTYCDKVLLYVANKFLQFNLRYCLCDIQKIGDKNKDDIFCAEQGKQRRV